MNLKSSLCPVPQPGLRSLQVQFPSDQRSSKLDKNRSWQPFSLIVRYFEDDYGDTAEPSEDFDKRTNSFAHALRVRRGYGDNR